MSTNSAIRGLNNFIGAKWAFIGFLLCAASVLWFLSIFVGDYYRTIVQGLPIPSAPFDFVVIFSLLFLGGFFMAWGNAMLRQREWGAFAGGLVRLVLSIYLLAGAVIFYQSPRFWLSDAALSFYYRYSWLVWSVLGLVILWYMSTTWFLLLGKSRRDYYAKAYQDYPAPGLATCPECGLVLKDGRCPEHQKEERDAYLRIGARRERLHFTEDDNAFVVGRQKDRNEAYITLSEKDCKHPERISGRHIMIQYHFDIQRFTVQDLASLNKTYLNDDPESLPPNEPRLLENGCKINLAHAVDMAFEYEESSI